MDLGYAKGFLVSDLLDAGVNAVGYDISPYALALPPIFRAIYEIFVVALTKALTQYSR